MEEAILIAKGSAFPMSEYTGIIKAAENFLLFLVDEGRLVGVLEICPEQVGKYLN